MPIANNDAVPAPQAAILQQDNVAALALEHIRRGTDWSIEQGTKDFAKPFGIGLCMILIAFLFLLATGMLSQVLNLKDFLHRSIAEQDWKDFNEGFRTIGTLITGVGFGIGLVQWRAARQEASFEKYYDRLKIANDRFDEARKSRLKEPPDSDGVQRHLYTMFVFAELDNLEYILEKHCQRYVHRDLVDRTIRHFWARCKDGNSGAEFRTEVRRWVGAEGEDEAAGYQERTRKAASFLARHAERAAPP
jgi:hypothetical protein